MAVGMPRHCRALFLSALTRDLTKAGFSIHGQLGTRAPATIRPPDNAVQVSGLRKARLEQIIAATPFISRMEENGVVAQLADGGTLDVSRIRPELQFCETRDDHHLFTYAKLFQQVPTTNRVGRQMRAVVYDAGQDRPTLMGIIELASSPYTLGCRDDYLGWRGNARKRVKDCGLRRVMDLASVMALPPYNYLFGGKLMAALALSDPVRREFKRRYAMDLLAVTTSSATGLHCAIVNRIGVRPGGLYRRIGATGGYSTLFVSPRTLRLAREFLPGFRSAPQGEFSESVRPLHILRVAMRACGVDSEPILRSAHPKGIYFGTISDWYTAALRSGKNARVSTSLPLDVITSYWRDRYLGKALADERRRSMMRAHLRRGPRGNPILLAA